jgi:hypothetical protein
MATTYAAAGPEMTVGGVLARAFSALGRAPALMFGTSFLLGALPYALLELGMRNWNPTANGTSVTTILTIGAGAALVWLLLYALAQAIMTRATVTTLEGHDVSAGTLVGAGLAVLLPLLGLTILSWLGIWAACLLLIVPGLMLATAWAVAQPALIVERRGVFAAFGRSLELTRGARWRILGLWVVIMVVYLVAGAAVGLVDLGVNGTEPTPGTRTSMLSIVAGAALQTVLVAVWAAINATLYLDLRIWKDGPAGGQLSEIFA